LVYLLVNFNCKNYGIKLFISNILSQDDEITYFGYTKKVGHKEKGPAIVGIETKNGEGQE